MARRSYEELLKAANPRRDFNALVEASESAPTVYSGPSRRRSFDELLATAEAETKPIGFGEAFIEDPASKFPFSPTGALDVANVVASARRLRDNRYDKPPLITKYITNEQLSKARMHGGWVAPMPGLPEKWEPEKQKEIDVEVVTNYLRDLEEKQRRGYTTMGRVGQITSEMPAFVTEFLTTGGIAALGKKGGKELAERVLRRHAATKAGRLAVGTAGFGGAALFRGTAMPHRAVDAILSRQVPEGLEIDDDGVVHVTKSGEAPFTSIWKGLADHYIEIASEQAGELLSPHVSKLIRKTPLLGKITNKIRGRWLKKFPKKTPADFYNKIKTKTGFHGVLEEVGEEYLGDATRAIFDVEHFGAGEDANMLERIGAAVETDTDILPAMLISFGIPGLGGNVLSNRMAKHAAEQDEINQRFKDLVAEAYFHQFHQIPSDSFLENALEQETLMGYEEDFFTEASEELKAKYTFKKPGVGKYFTPKWLLNRIMGVDTLLEDVIHAEEAFQLESAHLNSWVNKLTKKLKKEKDLARLPDLLPEEAELEATEVTALPEQAIETAEGTIGMPEEFEVTQLPKEKTKAHILQKKIGDNTNPLEIMRDLLDTYEDAPGFLNESETRIFNQVRELTRYLRRRANMVRERMGLEKIANVEGYITHWMDGVAKAIVDGELITEDPYIRKVMHELPKEVKNKTAYQRKVKGEMEKYFSKDLGKLLRVMTAFDLKDIYIKQPYEAAWEELNKYKPIMPKTVYDQARRFMQYDIRKMQALMDESFNATLKKPFDLINKLRPLHKVIHDPARSVFSFVRRLGIISGLGFRIKPGGRNLGQRLLLTDLYRTVDYARGQAVAFRLARMPMVEHPITGEKVKLIELIHEQDWYKLALRKFEDTTNVITGIERSALVIYSKTHVGNLFLSNVEVAAMTGYFDWKNMYQQSLNKKGKHFKNAQKMAKKLGVPLQELLTQKSDMMWHIREAVRRTQWEYFSTSMPTVYRSQFNRAMFMFQSWWMNYFFNHSREMINQTLTGRNSLGRLLTPGGRVRAVKGLGTIIAIGKASKALFGVEMLKYLFAPMPQYLPPVPELIAGIIQLLAARTEPDRKKAWKRVKYGLKFWVPFSAFGRDLNKLLSGEYSIADFLLYRPKEKENQ
jgi:hypothetical protein